MKVDLPADAMQIDGTGFVFTFLDEADDPAKIKVGTVINAGDEDAPFLGRVVDIVTGNSGRSIVRLDVIGVPADDA